MRDVIIIGAGGGGPVVAKELAARGLDVLLLEAGAHDDSEQDWSHFEADANSPASGFQRWGPADRGQRPWRRELPQNSLILQVSGVGGTTRHYFGISPRAMPGSFAGYEGLDADAYDAAHRFPFTYNELIPYYQWVEATLPVQTSPMGRKEEAFFRGAEAMGLPVQTGKDITRDAFRPSENAILQPQGTSGKTGDPQKLQFPQAKGCTFCGHCVQGCFMPRRAPRNLKAKRSTYNSYVPMALTGDLWSHGGRAVALVSDAFATQIHTDDDGEACGVSWRRGADGALLTEDARVVVLAAGTIESPRLWLNSGLPNPNDWVGRGLTDHAMDYLTGIMPFATDSSHGPATGARADFPGRGGFFNAGAAPANQAFPLGGSDAGMAGFYDNGIGPDASGADAAGRLVGPLLKHVVGNLDRLVNLVVITDDDVQPDNRVTLSSTAPPDEHGLIPQVTLNGRTRTARTRENREFLVARAVQLLRAAGATEVYRMNLPPVLIHIHSTMRMGIDPLNSVLDGNCEARGVRRLFVADNSALANAVGGPNPTLTTQALATRTAEKIFHLYFGGQPWVSRERPVSSIDARVTLACAQRGI
jgi:choline dehydrogenase-like flavoprotein